MIVGKINVFGSRQINRQYQRRSINLHETRLDTDDSAPSVNNDSDENALLLISLRYISIEPFQEGNYRGQRRENPLVASACRNLCKYCN